MKTLIAVLALASLTGCSTYQTHLRTGCIWSCDQWENNIVQPANDIVSNSYQPNAGISGRTYITPVGGYQVIRSGSTTTITRTSK